MATAEITTANEVQIQTWITEGLSRREVARRLGIGYHRVTTLAKRRGWEWKAAYKGGRRWNCKTCRFRDDREVCNQFRCYCEVEG